MFPWKFDSPRVKRDLIFSIINLVDELVYESHTRYMKCLFTKIWKQQNMLKSSLIFKKKLKFHGQLTREFLGLRLQNFQGTVFIQTRIYSEIFKFALV